LDWDELQILDELGSGAFGVVHKGKLKVPAPIFCLYQITNRTLEISSDNTDDVAIKMARPHSRASIKSVDFHAVLAFSFNGTTLLLHRLVEQKAVETCPIHKKIAYFL
jgi:hypothetical protein